MVAGPSPCCKTVSSGAQYKRGLGAGCNSRKLGGQGRELGTGTGGEISKKGAGGVGKGKTRRWVVEPQAFT